MSFAHSYSGPVTEKARFVIGLDLGQAHDPTAIAGVKHLRFVHAVKVAARGNDDDWREKDARPSVFQCGYLERVPLGTTYPGIVAHVARLMSLPVWDGNVSLAIDKTGVGAPVADLFKSAGISFAAVTITGGDSETSHNNDWRVPKITLVSRLQALLHEGRLLIQKDLPEAPNLVRELQDFRVTYTASGNLTFGAREGRHDDLVLALAIAVWRASKPLHNSRVGPFRLGVRL
ncbi:MAG TPA: hypothetical protein VGF92_07415 [Stellaceae bacterium]|jgi:hypothetical protein